MKKRITSRMWHGTLEAIGLVTVLYTLYLFGRDLAEWWDQHKFARGVSEFDEFDE